MQPVTLTSARLTLRPVGPQDTEAIHAAAQDPEIQRWTTIPSPYLPEHAHAFTTDIVPTGWATNTMYTFGVYLRTGPLTGMLSLTPRTPGTTEIGFWTAEPHRSHGYTTEATLTAAHWSFTHLATSRLEWRAEVGNTASKAVAQNAGFTFEGTLRSAIENKGVRRDCWLASLLPQDLNTPTPTPYLPSH
ncbi:GNAT family N-acetyltransferase [Streptomyces sp. V2]|uniref:GNAT family N-acetyltransferase n=1 Tax=Streptomyces TaxID=1883 RepID=UPI000D66CC0F|nr:MULTISPECIES: GNAT family N-acetyltransferase [unclassified Streptomyces]PWG10936.1 GNAT family N-acetyltransferase [Streptomyces sp. V2]QZZ28144.1 GNAT family N-acetyltransferase [Streptomyces sp. ST1015]